MPLVQLRIMSIDIQKEGYIKEPYFSGSRGQEIRVHTVSMYVRQ